MYINYHISKEQSLSYYLHSLRCLKQYLLVCLKLLSSILIDHCRLDLLLLDYLIIFKDVKHSSFKKAQLIIFDSHVFILEDKRAHVIVHVVLVSVDDDDCLFTTCW